MCVCEQYQKKVMLLLHSTGIRRRPFANRTLAYYVRLGNPPLGKTFVRGESALDMDCTATVGSQFIQILVPNNIILPVPRMPAPWSLEP